MKRGLVITLGLTLALLGLGCTSSEPIEDTEKSKENQFAIILGQLNVERPNMTVYRSVVEQLTRFFDQQGEQYKKQLVLNKDEDKALEQLLSNLDRVSRAPRLDDVRRSIFNTTADASHLDGCLLFRDAVRALAADLGEAPTPGTPAYEAYQLALADHLFGWTARQVTTLSQQGNFKNWPAHEILRVGAGDAEDRLRVFLSLLHQSQYDLDGCAILVKRQDRQDAQVVTRHVPVLAGVLIGKQIFLFDPARGLAIAGPDGKGIATLEQVRKTPDLLKAMPGAPTAAQLAEAEVVILAGLCGMAPRMKALQAEMEKLNNRVRLTEDLPARLKRFQDAGVAAKPWADPTRPGFPALTIHRYVESAKGGDPRADVIVRRDRLIPDWAIQADKQILASGAGNTSFLSDFDRQFVVLRLEPGGGRDLLVRGNATQAVSRLSQNETLLERSLDTFHRTREAAIPQIREMMIQTLVRQSQLIRQLEEQVRSEPSGSPKATQLLQRYTDVRRAYDQMWRESAIRSDILNMNRDWAMPELREHYTYFMGLAKLELALKAERRYRANPEAPWPADLPRPADQFASAAEWFRRYEAFVIPTGTGIWLDAVLHHRKFCDQKSQELRTLAK